MNFVKIELIGFKSFADKQEIQFNEGVTAIVGPNGCGKSNISDAIRWVLGEQSAKSLRGSSMQDVIFNGTQNRKSLSYCEVSLYFDNTNKIFPSLEYNDVCMTRKLFRSGESEYYLNKQPCRMKDIVNLLHECGVSKSGYTIIGQGKIAEIMNAKPEDRRAIFEEAVGIASTKAKKIDNERKLERTRENIIRIIDISSELEKDLPSKEAKAEKTREYLQLASEFKYHEINNFLFKSDNSHAEKEKIDLRIRGLEEEQTVKNADLEKAQQDFSNHQKESVEADAKIGVLSEEILNLSVGLEKQSGFTSLFNQEINYLQDDNTRLKNDISDKTEKIQLNNKAINAKEQSIKDAESDIDNVNARLLELSKELNSVNSRLSEGESATQDAQNKVLKSVESLADIKMNIGALSGEQSVISSQQQEVIEKMTSLSEKRNNLINEKSLCELSIERTLKEIASLKADIEDEENAIRSTNEYISQLNNKIYTLNADISSLTARKNVYTGLKESFSGYPDSVRNLMLAAKNNPTLGVKVKGLVASAIKTESKFETAIETLLGGAASNVITATPEDAQYLIEYLNKTAGGRVTFLPISSMRMRNNCQDLLRASKETCSLGIATSVVKYDPMFESVVSYLLGNTLICDTIQNAVIIAKRYSHAFRIVTLNGDIINTSGSMTGGSKRSNNANLLSTDRMLEQIEKDLKDKTAEINALNDNKEKSTTQVNELIEALERKEKELVESRQNIAILREKNVSTEKALTDVNAEIKANEGSFKQITERLEEIKRQYSDIEENNEKLAEARANASSDALRHQSQYEQLRKAREDLLDENYTLQTTLAALNSSISSSKEEISRLTKDRDDAIIIINKNKQLIEENNENIDKKRREIEKIALSTEEQTGLNLKRAELDKIKTRKHQLGELIQQDDLRRQMLISELNSVAQKLMEERIAITRIDSDLEYMQKHIEEEYGLTYENCVQQRDPDYNMALSNQEMHRIKRRISTLGAIDPMAVEEFNNLKERYEDYNRQRNDLEAAEADLKSVIKSITEEMLEIFNDGFETIRVNFKRIFKELFGGGSADLVIEPVEEGQDPLDAGIEIVAEPPGKKLTKISLLSGGEQALTATAILFAILRLRPMPFCVLDEIEAPLDDANVERVATYLKHFAEETQFVVITHKKVTMENADTLFGVTMEEKGVSKIVSVKLSDVNGDMAD